MVYFTGKGIWPVAGVGNFEILNISFSHERLMRVSNIDKENDYN